MRTDANAHAMAARDRAPRRTRHQEASAKEFPARSRALAVASASASRSALPGRRVGPTPAVDENCGTGSISPGRGLGPAPVVDESCGTGSISAEFIGLFSVDWNGVSSPDASPGTSRVEAFASCSCESSRQAGSLFHAADATRTLAAAAAESMAPQAHRRVVRRALRGWCAPAKNAQKKGNEGGAYVTLINCCCCCVSDGAGRGR